MRIVHTWRCTLLATVAVITTGGCSGLQRAYNYAQPGDTRHQRSIAIAHDPYPLNDLGPPIAGGRPKGFDKPLSEVQRAQLYNPPKRVLQPLPASPPVVISPQPVGPLSPWPAPPPGASMAPPAASAPPPIQTVPAPYQSSPLGPSAGLQ